MNGELTAYTSMLLPETTLCVFQENRCVFSDKGKWLMPLFALERFLSSYTGPRDCLCAHDTAVGKAAVLLMFRMGIRHIYADLASVLAYDFVAYLQSKGGAEALTLTSRNTVPRLLCATEDFFFGVTDIDFMYTNLRQRAQLVQGVPVKLENVTYDFGITQPLSLDIARGEHVMIRGDNGSGKTTLLKLLIGKYVPSSGSILIDGKKINDLPKRSICYIPQQSNTTEFSLSVEEVVALGFGSEHNAADNRSGRDIPGSAAAGKHSAPDNCNKHNGSAAVPTKKAKIRWLLERVSAEHLAGRSYNSLSGGEKQKVSLARCLAQKAKLVLLDEPTSAMDAAARHNVTAILRALTLSEIPTIIVVTHDEALIKELNWKTYTLDALKEPQ